MMEIEFSRPSSHFDAAALHHDLCESTPALLSVLRAFHPWLADMRARLRGAIETGNTEQLADAAHTLRGSLAQLRAAAAVELVRQLEAVCKADPGAPLTPDHPRVLALDAELEALSTEIADFLAAASGEDGSQAGDPA